MRRMIVTALLVVTSVVAPVTRAHATGGGWNALAPSLRSASVSLGIDEGRSVTATCHKNEMLLSGGAYFVVKNQFPDAADADSTFLIESYPTATSWKAAGFSTKDNVLLESYAYCTTIHFPTNILSASHPVSTGDSARFELSCPERNGMQDILLASGSALRTTNGKPAYKHFTALTGTTAENNQWRWSASGQTDAVKDVVLTSYLRCTSQNLPIHGFNYMEIANVSFPNNTAGGYVGCPSGSHVLAGSVEMVDHADRWVATDNVTLSSSSPSSDATSWYVTMWNNSVRPTDLEALVWCLND